MSLKSYSIFFVLFLSFFAFHVTHAESWECRNPAQFESSQAACESTFGRSCVSFTASGGAFGTLTAWRPVPLSTSVYNSEANCRAQCPLSFTCNFSSPSTSASPSVWQVQRNGAPFGEYPDKLTCANKMVEAVTMGGASESSLRCFNSGTSETMNFAQARAVIQAEADAIAAREAAAAAAAAAAAGSGGSNAVVNQCKVETPHFLPAGYWGQSPSLLPCGVGPPETRVDCLQCGLCGLLMLGQRIIYLMLSFLFFIIAPIRFIWGGFLILVSRGSSESVARGQKMIYHTVIGLLIGLGAFLMVQTFLWLLGNLGSDKIGWPDIKCQRNIRPLP